MISKEAVQNFFWRLLPFDKEVKQELKREKGFYALEVRDDNEHLLATAKWLNRAHSHGNDHGVSRAYNAAGYCGFGPKGWQASYPETTGYIIPTMFSLAEKFKDNNYSVRAYEMADWEIGIQLSSGAVMGSVVTAPPSPAVFNTGQVIFGWLAAFKQSKEHKYIDAAIKAGDYLTSVQELDGSWHKGDSKFALKGATTYNARVAWALIELGIDSGEEKYITVGRKNIDLALTKQLDNGWFSDNCLNDPANPLLHTIVYATRGILESGASLNETGYINAAIKTLDSLLDCQRPDGGISGRLDSKWFPRANWDCVTGDAQAAVVWLRANAINKNKKYQNAARKIIEFIKRTQNLEHPNPGFRGGVKGSFPFDGLYGQYEMLNWAAKFFCDALLLKSNNVLVETGIQG